MKISGFNYLPRSENVSYVEGDAATSTPPLMMSPLPGLTSLPVLQLPVLQPPLPHFESDFPGFSSSKVTNRKKGCFVGSLLSWKSL